MMYLELIFGFVLLFGGAEALVRGAVAVARRLNISIMMIGMTVVAFGTSAPEFVVSLGAAVQGSPGIALGNVIGSNIANILLILGVTGLIATTSLTSDSDGLTGDALVLLIATAVFGVIVATNEVARLEGILLLAIFAGFLTYSYWREVIRGDDLVAHARVAEVEDLRGLETNPKLAWMATLGGLVAICVGADWLVDGGVSLARHFGVTEEVIGLTLIAFGTSLPELATSVVAAVRRHPEIALGNVVGSNIFNMLLVAGGVATITPLAVPQQIAVLDVWAMAAVTLGLLPFLFNWIRFGRLAASLFLVSYAAYIWLLATGRWAALLELV